ncbi:MAG: hypothetical protein ACR2GH_09335 [Pseudonocardia sp.]
MAAPDPTELSRKLRQYDNEFEAVYELLQTLDRKVDAGFERVDERLIELTTAQQELAAGQQKIVADQQELAAGQRQILQMLRDLSGGDPTSS